MKIGMILDKNFPPDPRVENEAVALIHAGFEVFLFCLGYHKEPRDEIINGIYIRRYQSDTVEYKLSALAYTFPFYTSGMYKKIYDFLDKNKIEAVHVHDIRVAEAAFKAAGKLNLPVVLDLHDNMPEVMKDYPHLQKFPGKQLISPKKWKEKEEEFIERADKVVTVSQRFIDEVVNRTGISRKKIVLVPNTVRRSFYKNPVIDEDITERFWKNFTILYLGDTALRRGLITAIEAIYELRSVIKHLKLVIVGKSTTDDILKARVQELGLEDYVVFEGWQDVSLFPSYITASDICISPLYRSAQHDVAYANKLFQYMSFAKPVLVSDALAQKELVEETKSGLIHKEKDAGDLAGKILKLYKDPDLRNKLGLNGKRFIEEEFVWENVSEGLTAIYENLKNEV